MIKIIQSDGKISLDLQESNHALIKAMDITFKGNMHAVSLLPAGWELVHSNNRMICFNMGNLNPEDIFEFLGNVQILNVQICDENLKTTLANVVIEDNQYWENINTLFNNGDYYTFYDKEIAVEGKLKTTKIVKNNLIAIPEQFYLKDGTPYEGEYHQHGDFQAMTGAKHSRSSVNIYRKDAGGKLILGTNYRNRRHSSKAIREIQSVLRENGQRLRPARRAVRSSTRARRRVGY